MATALAAPDPAATLAPAVPAGPRAIAPDLSRKLRFWSLMAMVLLVYVHAYNLEPRYLQPNTLVDAPATWDNVLQYLLANGLLRFRIPILFAISGYLFAWRDTGAVPHRTRLLRRAKTLGIPYLAWSAIAILATWALEQWAVGRTLVASAALSPFGPDAALVGQYSAGQLLSRWLVVPVAFQLWFLRSLLVLTLLYPWIRVAVTRWPRAYFAVAGLLWLPGGGVFFVESEGLLFYALGVWLAARRVDVATRPRWLRPGLLAVAWVALCAVKTAMAFAIDGYSGPQSLAMFLLHRAGELLGLVVAWYGLDRLAQAAMARDWFRWLTAFSFMIYVMHVPLVNYATEAALHYGAGIPRLAWWTYLLVPVAVITTAVAAGVLLRTFARPVYGVLTGGRGLES